MHNLQLMSCFIKKKKKLHVMFIVSATNISMFKVEMLASPVF